MELAKLAKGNERKPYCDRLLRENCPTMQTHDRYDRIEQLIRDKGWEKAAAQIQKEIDNAGMLCLTEKLRQRSNVGELHQWKRAGQLSARAPALPILPTRSSVDDDYRVY